jgi:protein-S-isoprenylcysteine O-methyltransferase Ste14
MSKHAAFIVNEETAAAEREAAKAGPWVLVNHPRHAETESGREAA